MAFPSIRSATITSITTAAASHAVNLPATIRAGDTIFVFVSITVAGAIGWPDATWNEMFDSSPHAADDQVAAAWRKADGTEGSTITITCTSGKCAALAISVQGATDPNIRPPELSTVATGSGTEPNATTCTPTGGAKDYLWYTFFAMEGEQTGITSYPASYTLNQSGLANTGTSGAVTTNCTAAGAGRQLNAASEDAGVWDVTGTLDDWAAWTIAFHPAEAVTAGLENSRRYNPDVMLRTPASIGVVLTLAVNLLQTTLAPIEVAPPSQTDWPNPSKIAPQNMGFVDYSKLITDQLSTPFFPQNYNPDPKKLEGKTYVINLLENTLAGQDENHYYSHLVLIRNKFSIGINELTQVNNLLQTTLTPAEANPFIPISYPNPLYKERVRQDWIQDRKFFYEDDVPFKNDILNPPLRKPIIIPFSIDSFQFLVIQTTPIKNDFSNPPLKKRSEGFIFNKQIEEEQATPVVPILFPNPGIKEKVRQDWIQERKQFYEDNTPFKNDLPNPLLKRAGEGFIFSPQIQEEEELPIIPPIFNNPEIKRRIAETWIDKITIPVEIIFRQNDHPNPKIGRRNFHSGWTQTIKLAEDQVIIRNLLPNPILKVRIAESHVVNLLQSTLDPGVGQKPYNQNDWPLPLRKKIHPAWEDFYRFEDNAPTVGIYTTLPPALKRRSVQDWIDNPIEVLTAIAGQKPVGTIELPAFVTLKRKIPIEILTIRGRIFIIIPPNIIGREICLVSKLDEYSLESALAEYDFDSRIEIFDLESGGQDCE